MATINELGLNYDKMMKKYLSLVVHVNIGHGQIGIVEAAIPGLEQVGTQFEFLLGGKVLANPLDEPVRHPSEYPVVHVTQF